MPILWMMLDDQTRILLIQLNWERYGVKLDYPGEHHQTTVEPAIESTQEVEILMQQTRRDF